MSIFDLKTDSKPGMVEVAGKPQYVRVLSALDRDTFEQQWQNYRSGDSVIGIRPFMVAFCSCDADGKPEFESGSDANANKSFLDAVKEVGSIQAGLIQPIFDLAMKLNGFSSEDVDELEKKSD